MFFVCCLFVVYHSVRGILVPQPGLDPGPLAVRAQVLTTGPSRNSLKQCCWSITDIHKLQIFKVSSLIRSDIYINPCIITTFRKIICFNTPKSFNLPLEIPPSCLFHPVPKHSIDQFAFSRILYTQVQYIMYTVYTLIS